VGRYRTWVDLPYVSDHAPVVAQFDFHQFLVAYPFNLNPYWMTEVDFTSIVKELWWDTSFLLLSNVQHRLVWKLKVLKDQIKSWARLRRCAKLKRLESLEEEIRMALLDLPRSGMNPNKECRLKYLETEHNQILLLEEEHWRQKSCAVWLKCGDRNNKYFHKYASTKRNQKHI
jgi:hypothetical protein